MFLNKWSVTFMKTYTEVFVFHIKKNERPVNRLNVLKVLFDKADNIGEVSDR